ncbi:MAG: FG-GAP repeat protein [Desulfobulbia bacterium]
MFDATTGNLLQTFDDPTPTSLDSFGTSVAISGNNIVVGAYHDDTQGTEMGQVHLFDATTTFVKADYRKWLDPILKA